MIGKTIRNISCAHQGAKLLLTSSLHGSQISHSIFQSEYELLILKCHLSVTIFFVIFAGFINCYEKHLFVKRKEKKE